MRIPYLFGALLFGAFSAVGVAANQTITLVSLLNEMVDRDAIARFPDPLYFTKQASSYDRQSVSPEKYGDKSGWFANMDTNQFMRTEPHQGRTEHVMMDATGPGVVTRFWITTQETKNRKIRIYLDGSPQPAFVFEGYDLAKSGLNLAPPFWMPHTSYDAKAGKGGSTIYLPIPYAKGCKITFEGDLSDGHYHFYQINYRTYPAGTRMQTFTSAALNTARPEIERTGELLLHPLSNDPSKAGASEAMPLAGVLKPGDERSTVLYGPAAIDELSIALSVEKGGNFEQALRSTVLKVEFDGEQTIWSPVGDFSGTGVGGRELHGWYRDVAAGGAIKARWVMPFEKSAKLTLVNLGKQNVSYTLNGLSKPWKWDTRSMHFHVNWNLANLSGPPDQDWNLNTMSGKGVFVGDTLGVFNPVRIWYGEGDEKIWTDDENFPSDFGTGTEDYYNASWAPVVVYHTPWASATRADDTTSAGHNTFTRTRNLDAVPFSKSLKFDFEQLALVPMKPTYTGTTYWYGRPGAKSNVKLMPVEAARPIDVLPPRVIFNRPGAIEFENMKVASAVHASVQPFIVDFMPGEKWSGDSLAYIDSVGPNASIEFIAPSPDDKPHKLTFYALKGPWFGAIVRFAVNGTIINKQLDAYGAEFAATGPIDLGAFEPVDRQFAIKAEIVGKNPAQKMPSSTFNLDCLVLSAP
jgi:hypothetical protein